MAKHFARLTVFTFLIASLAALPAMAQPIPAGPDYWRTPSNGQTFFEFPTGDVESLCGLPPLLGWSHQVALKGVPQAGSDWDTIVYRLDPVSAGKRLERLDAGAGPVADLCQHHAAPDPLR
jgi:hypothetical protein